RPGDGPVAGREQLHLLEPADLVAHGDQRVDAHALQIAGEDVVDDVRSHAVGDDDQWVTGPDVLRGGGDGVSDTFDDGAGLLGRAPLLEVHEDVANEVCEVRLHESPQA